MTSSTSKSKPRTLRTIGYGNRSFEQMTTKAKELGVHLLVDVRSRPHSKFQPDFNRPRLEDGLPKVGLDYIFMGDFLGGIPDEGHRLPDGRVDYKSISQERWFMNGLRRLASKLDGAGSVSLMCSELRPEKCHRAKLLGYLFAQHDIEVEHIDENYELKTQSEVIHRLTKGQLTLGNDESFAHTSRRPR